MSTGIPTNKEMGCCILVGAGDLALSRIERKAGDICIAVDGGFARCERSGLEPDYFVGDRDSLDEGLWGKLDAFRAGQEDRAIFLPVKKDDTDMLAALRLGLEKGHRDFRIYGGLGGRLEHTLANIQCLLYLKEQGAAGYLMDSGGMVLVAKEEAVSFQEGLEGYCSLFSLGERAMVSIQGMKYNLNGQEITNSFPIGVSNEFMGKKATVTVHQGAVVILISLAPQLQTFLDNFGR